MGTSQKAILFLASWYPVEYNPTHGIFIRNHAIALSKYCKVVVAYAYCSREKPHCKVNKIKVNDNLTEYFIRFTKPAFSFKPFSSALQFLKLRHAHKLLITEIKKHHDQFNAIQVNVVFPAALVLDLYKSAFKTEHTILEHWSGYLPEDGNYEGGMQKKVTEKCVKGAQKIWHISAVQKEAMISHGLNGNYELIYNVVDTAVFTPVVQEKSRCKFLHVSSLVEREKNIESTFNAMKTLQDKGYDFDFTVVGGDNEELKTAKNIAKKLNLKNIEFTGVQKPAMVAKYMQESSALVLFSNFEGMPVVVLEALACGLPVIAGRVGQLPQIINDEFGILTDVNNQAQLVTALERIINKQCNFNSSAMRDFVVQHASYEAVGKQMYTFYENISI